MKTVSNQELTIRVSEHGAELSSIVANATGKEYLWQADPAFWKRHSPVLFPIVGSVWKAEYRNEGTVYPLSQHGFARDMDFTLIDEAENELRFALESTPDTLRAYPFPFLLEIGYRLEGNKVEVLWHVKNTGDKTMHFQIGAHPAFLYPNYEVDQPDRGYFAFDVKKELVYRALVEKGCVGDVVRPIPLDADGLLPLNLHAEIARAHGRGGQRVGIGCGETSVPLAHLYGSGGRLMVSAYEKRSVCLYRTLVWALRPGGLYG